MDATVATQFLLQLNPEGPWNLSTIHPDTGDIESVVAKTSWRMQSWIEKHNGTTNIYFTPNPVLHSTGWKGRCANRDYVDGYIAVVDIDSAYKAGVGNAEVVKDLQRFHCPPTHIVFSGGGIQAYWKFAERVPKAVLEMINQGLIERFNGDKGTYTIERLCRVPGTTNLPNAKKRGAGRVPTTATVLQWGDEAREVDSWELPMRPIPPKKGESIDDVEPDLDLDWSKVVHDYNLRARLVYLVEHGRDREDSKQGDRSRYIYQASCALLRANVPFGTIGAILLEPDLGISEGILAKGEDEAWRQMNRAIRRGYSDVVEGWKADAAKVGSEFDDEEWDQVTNGK